MPLYFEPGCTDTTYANTGTAKTGTGPTTGYLNADPNLYTPAPTPPAVTYNKYFDGTGIIGSVGYQEYRDLTCVNRVINTPACVQSPVGGVVVGAAPLIYYGNYNNAVPTIPGTYAASVVCTSNSGTPLLSNAYSKTATYFNAGVGLGCNENEIAYRGYKDANNDCLQFTCKDANFSYSVLDNGYKESFSPGWNPACRDVNTSTFFNTLPPASKDQNTSLEIIKEFKDVLKKTSSYKPNQNTVTVDPAFLSSDLTENKTVDNATVNTLRQKIVELKAAFGNVEPMTAPTVNDGDKITKDYFAKLRADIVSVASYGRTYTDYNNSTNPPTPVATELVSTFDRYSYKDYLNYFKDAGVCASNNYIRQDYSDGYSDHNRSVNYKNSYLNHNKSGSVIGCLDYKVCNDTGCNDASYLDYKKYAKGYYNYSNYINNGV